MNIPPNSYTIIIGSMKSGTSSFYHYLIQHPEICPAKTKEPEFFSENQIHGLKCDKYSDLWEFDLKKHKIALEASTGYTKYPFEQNVPKSIFEYGIKPKMFYCVRNPIDRIYSQHEYSKNYTNWGNQDILSDQLTKLSNYYLQLEQFRKYFPKENILIIDFEDISKNPQKAVSQAFTFMNLSHIVIDSSIIYNKSGKTDEFGRKVNEGIENKKSKMSDLEKEQIFYSIKDDMKRFEEEYHFDISKWGF